MSDIGHRSEKEFVADFPLNFGNGIRGDFVRYRNKVAGIVLVHRKNDGLVCANAVYWVKVENRPLWKLVKEEPLTLDPSIKCSCGLYGWIREGKWENAIQ